MHGTWSDFVFAFIIAGVLIYLPGYVIARGLGIHRFLSIGVAPIISVALVATTAVGFGALGIPWTLVGLFFVALIVLVFSLIFRVLLGRDFYVENLSWRNIFIPFIITITAGTVLLLRTVNALKVPYAISQTYDANYHYNNVANMLETKDLSSLNMLQLPPNETFYPAAWHDFVTNVINVTGVSIPVASNAVAYFFLSVVWPLSMLMFALCISRNVVFLSAVSTISVLVPFFPGMYLWFGMLYANIVASSFLPAVLMVVVAFLFRQGFFQWWQSVLLGVYALLALVFSQPNSVFTVYYVVLVVLPFAGYKLGKELDKNSTVKNRVIFVLLALLVDVLLEVIVTYISLNLKTLYGLRFSFNVIVQPIHGYKSGILAFLSATTDGYNGSFLPYLYNAPIAILMFVGVFVILWRRKNLWLVLAWLWFAFINFVAASLPNSYFRAFISGVYYGERMRLVSVQAIFMVIFIALAVLFIFEKIRFVSIKEKSKYVFNKFTILGLVVVFVAGQFVPSYAYQFDNLAVTFGLPENNFDNNAEYSKKEFDFMEKTGKKLDKNYTVVGNPWKGATASWFLFNHKNVFYHPAYPSDEKQLLIVNELNKAKTNPKVCEVVKHFKLRYVYSFAGKCLWGRPCEDEYPGLNNLVENGVAHILDEDKYGNQLLELSICQ